MTVIHVGSKTWPPSHGGVEKVVYDLATGLQYAGIVVLADHVDHEAALPRPAPIIVDQLARGLLAARSQLLSLGARQNDVVLHFHKETMIPLALLMKLSGARCLLTLHGFGWRLRRWAWWQRLALWLLDFVAYLVLDRIVFVGEQDWKAVRRWLPLEKLRLIRNGVPIDRPSTSIRRTRRWVFLGRISPEKNVNAMIESAISAKLGLDLYGPLDERDAEFLVRFRRLATQPGICWHGPLRFQDVPRVLAAHPVLVNVSHSEGLPVSVLEGAAQGLFLVLSNIPQHRLLRFPNVCYVDPRSPDFSALAQMALDGADNRIHVEREFAIQHMVSAYEELIREFTSSPPKERPN